MTYRIEAFEPGRHDTKNFGCGSDSQDNFLRRTAKRQQRDGYTRLYVATDAALRAPRSNLIPGVFLSHLAVDRNHQGQGLGRILLVDAMQQCQRAGQILGVRLMVLDVAALARTTGAVVHLHECLSPSVVSRNRYQSRRCLFRANEVGR